MNTETKNIEDIDSHKLELFSERLPTDDDVNKHTYLVLRIMYPDYYDSDWHRQIATEANHKPETRNYTSKFSEKHCEACFSQLEDTEKQYYIDQWNESEDIDDKEACECIAETFHVELLAVNPGMQSDETIKEIENEFDGGLCWSELSTNGKINVLVERGTHATLWQQSGIDETELINQAKEQYQQTLTVGGFQLDQPQNAIGSTGWDFMKGEI